MKSLSSLLRRAVEEFGRIYRSRIVRHQKVDSWYQEMSNRLRFYHTAAYLLGARIPPRDLTPEDRQRIDSRVSSQLAFLRRFMADLRGGRYESSPGGGQARAQLYAAALRASWWEGKTRGLPLPAQPGDGTTQCISRCNCSWEIHHLGGDDYDCYWRLGSSDASCQTCIARSRRWNPLRIRNGRVQVTNVHLMGFDSVLDGWEGVW
jgi:hypothetical protein